MDHGAFSLLTEGRSLLVEAGPAGRVRHPARLLQAARGAALGVEFLGGADPAGFPRTGERANLVVPIRDCTWSFPAVVLRAPTAEAPVGIFGWPERAEQLGGRRAPRVERAFAVRCRPAGGEEGWTATYTLDLSASGLRTAFPRPLAEGTTVELEIGIPGRVLEAEGTVAWQRPLHAAEGDPMFTMGIRLRGLGDAARSRLHALVQREEGRRRMDQIR